MGRFQNIKITNLKTGAVFYDSKYNFDHYLNKNLKNLNKRESKLIGCIEQNINVLDFDTLTCLNEFKEHQFYICCIEILSDNLIASGSYDHMIKIWDIKANKCINSFECNSPVICLKKIRNNRLAAGGTDMSIIILDLNTTSLIKTLQDTVVSLCLEESETGSLICGTSCKYVRVWDIYENVVLRNLRGHMGYVTCLKILPNNKLISGSKDNTIKVWNLDSGELLKSLEGHSDTIMCFSCIHHEDVLISGSMDKKIKLWSLSKGICLKTLDKHGDGVNSVLLLMDDKILSASLGEILIWNLNNCECVNKYDIKYQKICKIN